ncbi:MAG TPA: hypothetical protein VGO48_08355 [Conexibacter sp.]|nr:hypothetical protein [Conexibacter sp.]
MSAVRPSPTTPGALLCPRCGNTLREDQGWCLECGLAARTRVHPPPSWRMPVVLTCVLLALLAAGIAVALVTLLDTPESTPPPATVTVPAATAPAPTTPAATVPTTSVPTTTVPTTTVPTTPTTPTTTSPGATTSPGTTTPTGNTPRTFTIPGTRITLPANATR